MPKVHVDFAPIVGTGGDDEIIVDFAHVDAMFDFRDGGAWNHAASVWSRVVVAEGGDDLIIRDRIGDYKDGVDDDHVRIYGDHAAGFNPSSGSPGNDTVSYQLYGGGIEAELQHDDVGIGLFGSMNGWVKQYGLSGETIYGQDFLQDIENLIGTDHADKISGSDGDNVLQGRGGNDMIWGLDGNDYIYGGTESDQIWGDDGNDRLYGEAGNDTMFGGEDNDHLYGGSGSNTLWGGTGNDKLYLQGGKGFADGGDDNDEVYGGSLADTLKGGKGNDKLEGNAGNDTLEGGEGSDTIDGGDGLDTVIYRTNGDVSVNYTLPTHGFATGAMGYDSLDNIEKFDFGSGNDTFLGNNGSNHVLGNDGDDRILGRGGNDLLIGGEGNDEIEGGAGIDVMHGDEGEDEMNGGDGSDVMLGGDGDDLMIGDEGVDFMTGGSGADMFRWLENDGQTDIIHDFELGTDKISFGLGYLANPPGIGEDYGYQVVGIGTFDGTLLSASTPEGGHVFANLKGVDWQDVNAAIADGSLFAQPTPAFDPVGGFSDERDDPWANDGRGGKGRLTFGEDDSFDFSGLSTKNLPDVPYGRGGGDAVIDFHFAGEPDGMEPADTLGFATDDFMMIA